MTRRERAIKAFLSHPDYEKHILLDYYAVLQAEKKNFRTYPFTEYAKERIQMHERDIERSVLHINIYNKIINNYKPLPYYKQTLLKIKKLFNRKNK